MTSTFIRGAGYGLLSAVLLFTARTLHAEDTSDIADDAIPGWKHWTRQVEDLDKEIIARLPERLRNDPQVRKEAGRLLLEVVASESISAIGADPDHPVFLPAINFYLNVGQRKCDPNSIDYLCYRRPRRLFLFFRWLPAFLQRQIREPGAFQSRGTAPRPGSCSCSQRGTRAGY